MPDDPVVALICEEGEGGVVGPYLAALRRLIEFCTALPAISRSSLVRLAGALRTACAECTYKMEPPEPGSDDEFDQFDY